MSGGQDFDPTMDTNNAVNSPIHYQIAPGVEVIHLIQEALTPEEFRGFLKGNAIKYINRAHKKGGKEDWKKAAKYIEWHLKGGKIG